MADQQGAEFFGMGVDIVGEALTDEQPYRIGRQRDRHMIGISRDQCSVERTFALILKVILIEKTCGDNAITLQIGAKMVDLG